MKGSNSIYDKKLNTYTSPDLSKMQAVIIDIKTVIYIAPGADPKKARSDYFARIGAKKI
jgi:hypothetical protein